MRFCDRISWFGWSCFKLVELVKPFMWKLFRGGSESLKLLHLLFGLVKNFDLAEMSILFSYFG